MTAHQLDMFTDAAPDVAQSVDVTAARSQAIEALNLITTWTGSLYDLIDRLPDWVHLGNSIGHPIGRRFKLGTKVPRWSYCLSHAGDGRPGTFPIVCIAWLRKDIGIGGTCRNASAGDSFQALLVFADGNEITGNAMFNSRQWVIVATHAVYDMAGRFMRARDAV